MVCSFNETEDGSASGELAACSVYQIYFRLVKPVTPVVGRLGRVRFSAGWYFYTGSARRAIEARIRRHFARKKKIHWHIDRLLSRQAANVAFALAFEADLVESECSLHQRTLSALSATTPVPGFGSSDCRAGCQSHLARLAKPVSAEGALAALEITRVAGEVVVVRPGHGCRP